MDTDFLVNGFINQTCLLYSLIFKIFVPLANYCYPRLDQYCATLAHKANHSFTPNTRWGRLDHPRFGQVVTIIAIKDIQVGEEVSVNYKYPVILAPEWYKQCHKLFYQDKAVPKIY